MAEFTIISYNVCGVNNPIRKTELEIYIHKHQPSVLVLQEPKVNHTGTITRNNKTYQHTIQHPPAFANYSCCCFNHESQPTGIIMYIHKSCTFMPLHNIPHSTPYRPKQTRTILGFVWVSSPLLTSPIIIGGAYIACNATMKDISSIANHISQAAQPLAGCSAPAPVVVLGDFNARHPSWDRQAQIVNTKNNKGPMVHKHLIAPTAQALHTSLPRLTLLNTHFTTSHHVPTHSDNTSQSVIDLALCTSHHTPIISNMDVLDNTMIGSDHSPIMLTFHPPATCPPVDIYTSRPIAPIQESELEVDFESKYDGPTPAMSALPSHPSPPERVRWKITNDVDWKPFQTRIKPPLEQWIQKYESWAGNNTPDTLTQTQIDTCWQEWLDIVIDAADTTLGKINTPPNSKQWWRYAQDIHSLHETYRKARRDLRAARRVRRVALPASVLADTKSRYLKAKGAFLRAVHQGKKQYWDGLAAAIDDHTPNNKHKPFWKQVKRLMPKMDKPGQTASFPDAQGNPPLTPQHSLDNMAAHLANISSLTQDPSHDAKHEDYVMEYVTNHIPDHADVREPPPFSLDQIKQACLRFRLNTALGCDNVSPYFLTNGGDIVYKSLFTLFSILSRHGMAPSSFRHGQVATLYKGDGEVNDPNNYRPITITSVVARLYERIHVPSLTQAMLRAGIPSIEQFGFTAKRSCHDAIYRLLTHIVETIDQASGDSRYVPAVFVDISKAYDKVWLDGLLYKIYKMGITGNLYYTIKSLLINRTIEAVSTDGKVSALHRLTAGVPQGSIWAPFLFLIYIHDINIDIPQQICLSMFADDIALLPLMPGYEGFIPLQQALSVMTRYASLWKITFSSKKTNLLYFHPYQPTGEWIHPPAQFTLGGFTITPTKQYTYLGVILDSLLTFTPQALNCIKTATRTASLISRLVRRDKYPSFPVVQTLVKCIVVPQLTYGFPFFSIEDKSIKTSQATGNRSSKSNLYTRAKNAILRPLIASLGLPHDANHDSVFVESRLFDVSSLFVLCSARLAHRLLNMDDDTTNMASHLFKRHLLNPPSNHRHPFNYIWNNISEVFGLSSRNKDDIIRFKDLTKKQLVQITWSHQYRTWWNSIPDQNGKKGTTPPTLRQWYPLQYNAPSMQVPHYLHRDHPSTAARRARLRFGRALLCSFLHQRGFVDAPNPFCKSCNPAAQHVESVTHTITTCQGYMMERIACQRELDAAMRGCAHHGLGRVDEHVNTVLSPEMSFGNNDKKLKKHLNQVISITGKFIEAIYDKRKF
jgi:exonuclease III